MNLLVDFKSLITLDPLAYFFIAVILLVSLPSLVYSIGYFKGEFTRVKLFSTQLITLAFIASMLFLVMANNALLFLVAWELMTLFSFLLVLTDGENKSAINAASIYMIMTQCGTAFLMAAFFIIYRHSGSFDFSAMYSACQTMTPFLRNWLFVLFFIGFGTKAGIVPLHIWLPYAHPQAPSHISSIMSGVMIKIALYGFIRFVFYILGISSVWWGIVVIIFAIITCLVGIIYALMDQNLKRLLAYSSVENIGIILLGLGLSMIFIRLNLNNLAALAMIAGLYHIINHAAFKGLLFLCAGSVQKGTGTLNIEKLGGLIKKMPWTALFFIVGAIGIAALPPLNGFVSEWLLLQAFFSGTLKVHGLLAIGFAISVAALALTSGLSAACFVRAFGITFLALPRSCEAENAHESVFSMRFGMLMLGAAVAALGLCAPFVFSMLSQVVAPICKTSINIQDSFFLQAPLMIAALLGLGVAFALVITFVLSRKKARVVRTWDCGYYQTTSRNEYTAIAFSKPFRISFSFFLLPFRKTSQIKDSFYHVKAFAYETYTTKIFMKYFYDIAVGLLLKCSMLFKRIQAGSMHIYISYILITIALLMLVVRIFR